MTKNVAQGIKEKVKEMEIGDKLYYAGGKTADILYSASYKVYEKGTELAVNTFDLKLFRIKPKFKIIFSLEILNL